MRLAYDTIRARGAELVAIGTGDAARTREFALDEGLPYPLLADPAAEAATLAAIERVSPLRLFHPDSYAGARRAWRAGHRIGISGKRVDQLGSAFVIGPGPELRFEHRDRHTADHAPIEELLAALA